eukprot:3939491-Rhodomonas_salina.1
MPTIKTKITLPTVRVTQLLVLARRASALLRRQLAQLVDASSELQDRACSLRVRPLRPPPPTLDVFIQRQPLHHRRNNLSAAPPAENSLSVVHAVRTSA